MKGKGPWHEQQSYARLSRLPGDTGTGRPGAEPGRALPRLWSWHLGRRHGRQLRVLRAVRSRCRAPSRRPLARHDHWHPVGSRSPVWRLASTRKFALDDQRNGTPSISLRATVSGVISAGVAPLFCTRIMQRLDMANVAPNERCRIFAQSQSAKTRRPASKISNYVISATAKIAVRPSVCGEVEAAYLSKSRTQLSC